MEKRESTTTSKDRIPINRAFVTLKVAAASALLIFAFDSTYGLVLHGAKHTGWVVVWLILFEGMSWAARHFVERPLVLPGFRRVVSFLSVCLMSSILCPFGSLFIRTLPSFVSLFGPPATEMAKAGIDMLFIGVPLTAYIHYTILVYEDTDSRTLRQRFESAIDYFMEKKIRLYYLAVSAVLLYVFYFSVHGMNGSPIMSGLVGIEVHSYFPGYSKEIRLPVGGDGGGYRVKITGTFLSGRTDDIGNPIFGTKYTSSNPSVAAVSLHGAITGVAPGHAVVRAENRGYTAEIPVRIYLPMKGDIALRADEGETVLPGSEVTLYATVKSGSPKKVNLKKMDMRIRGISGLESATLSGDVFVCTLKMPDGFAGETQFHASGSIDDGSESVVFYTSNTVSLLVKPDLSKLVGLKFSHEGPAICAVDRFLAVRVIGVFSDGREYFLSGSRLGTVLSLGDPSLAEIRPFLSGIFPTYNIKCRATGETEIIATNSGFSASLPLIIIP